MNSYDPPTGKKSLSSSWNLALMIGTAVFRKCEALPFFYIGMNFYDDRILVYGFKI